ncbi:MAG: type II toxin-antitoxin system HicA family toxin [Candidatus Acidiferrum sp.]
MKLAELERHRCRLPHTVISNVASRRFFLHVRSCERVGLRREKSLFLFSPKPAHRHSYQRKGWLCAIKVAFCIERFASQRGAHSIWFNPNLRTIASVPRHREIKEGTVRAICKQLEIPQP